MTRRLAGALLILLMAIVVDRVRTAHGVDRDVDPERFVEVVGPDLVAWLDASSDPTPVTARQLAAVLTRIEAL